MSVIISRNNNNQCQGYVPGITGIAGVGDLGCEGCGGCNGGVGEIVSLVGKHEMDISQEQGVGGLGDYVSNFFGWEDPSTSPANPASGGSGGSDGSAWFRPFTDLTPFSIGSPITDMTHAATANAGGTTESTTLDFFHNLGLDTIIPSTSGAGAGNPGASSNANAGGGNLWQTILAGTAATFNSIARSKYGVPPPNTYIQTNRDGSQTIVRLPTDAAGNVTGAFTGLSLGTTGSSPSLMTLLLLGGGLLLVLKMGSK